MTASIIEGIESAIRLHKHGWSSESEFIETLKNIIKEAEGKT